MTHGAASGAGSTPAGAPPPGLATGPGYGPPGTPASASSPSAGPAAAPGGAYLLPPGSGTSTGAAAPPGSGPASPATSASPGAPSGGNSAVDPVDALAAATADGANAGSALGPASIQGEMPAPSNDPGNSASAGMLGFLGNDPGAAGSAALNSTPSSPLSPSSAAISPMPVPASKSSSIPVGGVLFDRAAEASFSIRELAFAGDEMVLITDLPGGPSDTDIRLDRVFVDALMTAARAELLGDHIWISIDPPSRFRDGLKRGKLPPAGTPLLVSYGHCANTATGTCLFASDLLFKQWSHGRHPQTQHVVAPAVPGFRPLIDMLDPDDGRAGCWQRFWFVTDQVTLALSPGGSIMGSLVTIRARTETEGSGEDPDPVAARFTRHINEHYDAYARSHPELRELRLHALASATAMWLIGQGKLDPAVVFHHQPETAETPESTAGVIVESPVRSQRIGDMIVTRKCLLFGGVDLTPRVSLVASDIPSLVGHALNWRKSAKESWVFRTGREWQRATAVRVAGPFPRPPGPPRLEIVPPSAKHQAVVSRAGRKPATGENTLVLHRPDGTVGIYRRAPKGDRLGQSLYCRTVSQTRTETGFEYGLDPGDTIGHGMLGRYTAIDRRGPWARFDRQGGWLR